MKPQVINFAQYRIKDDRPKRRKRPRKRIKGSVIKRGGKLWVDFRYLGERVREPSGLDDTELNRKMVRKQLNLIMAEIENGLFEFAKRFPKSKRRAYFAELEGNRFKRTPDEIIFSEYVEKWWKSMKPGMSESQVRDYTSILKSTLLPLVW